MIVVLKGTLFLWRQFKASLLVETFDAFWRFEGAGLKALTETQPITLKTHDPELAV